MSVTRLSRAAIKRSWTFVNRFEIQLLSGIETKMTVMPTKQLHPIRL